MGDDAEHHGWCEHREHIIYTTLEQAIAEYACGSEQNLWFAHRATATMAVVTFSADKLDFPALMDLDVPTHFSKEPRKNVESSKIRCSCIQRRNTKNGASNYRVGKAG